MKTSWPQLLSIVWLTAHFCSITPSSFAAHNRHRASTSAKLNAFSTAPQIPTPLTPEAQQSGHEGVTAWMYGTRVFTKLTMLREGKTTNAAAEGQLKLQPSGMYEWQFRVATPKQPSEYKRFTGKFRIHFMVKGEGRLEEETTYKFEREDKTSGSLILTHDYPVGGKDIYVLQPAVKTGAPTLK